MCTFITATINRGADLDGLVPLFARLTCGFVRIDDPHIEPQLPPGRVYLRHATPVCDCGTPIGSMARVEAETWERHIARQMESRRRKGWSEARLARWLQNKQKARANTARGLEEQHPSAGPWLALVRETLEHPSCRVFGLMHHFYKHVPGAERFTVTARAPLPLAQATERMLMELPRDTLLEFAP